jgi:hypothetical protein
VTDTSLKVLGRYGGLNKGLRELNISQCAKVTSKGILEVVGNCKDLRMLKMVNVLGVNKEVLEAIFKNMGKLQGLSLGHCQGLGSQAFEILLEIAEEVEQGSGGDERVVACANSLKHLNLGGIHRLNDDCLMGIRAHFRNLEKLELGGCRRITDIGLGRLVEGCNKIRMLDLEECVLVSDQGLASIGVNLGGTLEVLRLCFCERITNDGVINMLK